MSLSETAAKAKQYGLSYGQYCLRKEMGTLPPEPKSAESEPENPPKKIYVAGEFKWTKEITEQVMRLYREGNPPRVIAQITGIPRKKIGGRICYLKRRYGKHI